MPGLIFPLLFKHLFCLIYIKHNQFEICDFVNFPPIFSTNLYHPDSSVSLIALRKCYTIFPLPTLFVLISCTQITCKVGLHVKQIVLKNVINL